MPASAIFSSQHVEGQQRSKKTPPHAEKESTGLCRLKRIRRVGKTNAETRHLFESFVRMQEAALCVAYVSHAMRCAHSMLIRSCSV